MITLKQTDLDNMEQCLQRRFKVGSRSFRQLLELGGPRDRAHAGAAERAAAQPHGHAVPRAQPARDARGDAVRARPGPAHGLGSSSGAAADAHHHAAERRPAQRAARLRLAHVTGARFALLCTETFRQPASF